MDPKAASTKIDQNAKTTDSAPAGKINRAAAWVSQVLDSAAPTCAPIAARWDAEADRRRQLRTPEHLKALMVAQRENTSARVTAATAKSQRKAAKAANTNPFNGARRAARTAARAASGHAKAARADLKAAKKNYPDTLNRAAVKAHALHIVPAALTSWAMSSAEHWTLWPGEVSLSLVAANVLVLWLGRRQVSTVVVEDDASVEERQLMERLDPAYWVQHAPDRGLGGTVTTPAALTAGGIECEIRLDGTWTVGKLRAAEESIRALLGARTALRMEVGTAKRGGWALLTLRTRSAADGDDLKWSPENTSFGIDTVTGEPVTVPLGERLLIAGRSGAGKSVASRPLLFDASEGETDRLVIIDLKQVEGRLWDHRARVASDPEAVIDLVNELAEEMTERLSDLPKGQATLVPTARRPRITVVVDEGAEVVSVCSDVESVIDWTEKGKPITVKRSALPGLESLARMGRAACIDLWWMTQKPTINDGIPKQIAPQISTSICLAVRTPAEARVVLGEDAQAKGWNADELPAPGVALVRDGKRPPNPVSVRYMTDAQVMALPDRPLWSRYDTAEPGPGKPRLSLVKPLADAVPEPREETPAAPASNRDRVLQAVKDGARTPRDVTDRTGINKGNVSRAIKSLIESGALVKGDDGMLTAKGGAA